MGIYVEQDAQRMPTHTPGAGLERLKQVWGGRVPEFTEEDERRTDEILAEASRRIAARRAA